MSNNVGQLMPGNLFCFAAECQTGLVSYSVFDGVLMGVTKWPESLPLPLPYIQLAAEIVVQHGRQPYTAIGPLIVLQERDDYSRQGQPRTV